MDAVYKPNHVIKNARLSLGLTEQQAADKIGIHRITYFDLELHEDELVRWILKEIFPVCDGLRLHPCELFNVDHRLHQGSSEDLRMVLSAKCSQLIQREFSALEYDVAWELPAVLEDGYALLNYGLDGVYNLCVITNTDYWGVLSDLYRAWQERRGGRD